MLTKCNPYDTTVMQWFTVSRYGVLANVQLLPPKALFENQMGNATISRTGTT